MIWLIIILLLANSAINVNTSCPFMKKSLRESEHLYNNILKNNLRLRNDKMLVEPPQPGWQLYTEYTLPGNIITRMHKSSQLVMAEQYYDQQYQTSITGPQYPIEEKLANLESQTDCIPKPMRCKPTPKCDPKAKYRTIDGTCNNLQRPNIGSTFSQYTRILPPVYNDGLHEVRRSYPSSESLKSPRNIGNVLYNRTAFPELPEKILNFGAISLGQFIAHDAGNLVNTGTGHGGGTYRCCAQNYAVPLPIHLRNEACEPISVPRNDPYYSQYNMTCMEFIRSQTIQRNDCKLGPSEKNSIATGILDTSNLYGRDLETSYTIRSFIGGQLTMGKGNSLTDTGKDCSSIGCVLIPDIRDATTPILLQQNTMFVRLHNQFARQLQAMHPQWTDETLYQESRRIIIAIYQHIVIDEWLRLIIGDEFYDKYFSCTTNPDNCASYKEDLNLGSFVEFSTAALRFFHGLIPVWFNLMTNSTAAYAGYPFGKLIYNVDILMPNFLGILRGSLYTPAWFENFSDQLRNHAFNGYKDIGIDLSSIDIARARDDGIPPYYQFLEACEPNVGKINDWNDLEVAISSENIEALKSVYESVFDVDINVGIYLERKHEYLGPVARFIFIKQFQHYIHADRFFYESKNSANPFTNDQLQLIKSINYATILCQTTDLEALPKYAFQMPNEENNPIVRCANIPKINLKLWS